MKKLFKIVFVLIAFALICGSCHKYPDDPFISLKEPQKRLQGNTWKFTSYKINGVEHSHDFDNFLSPHTLTDVTFQFETYEDKTYYLISNVENEQLEAGYSWSSDSKSIAFNVVAAGLSPVDSTAFKFAVNVLQDTYSNTNASIVYWTVEELYNSTFHISRNGTDIYFKKQ